MNYAKEAERLRRDLRPESRINARMAGLIRAELASLERLIDDALYASTRRELRKSRTYWRGILATLEA